MFTFHRCEGRCAADVLMFYQNTSLPGLQSCRCVLTVQWRSVCRLIKEQKRPCCKIKASFFIIFVIIFKTSETFVVASLLLWFLKDLE